MNLTLPPGADPAPYQRATEALLGLPATPQPASGIERSDPATAALVVLQLPLALLATWDLAERIGLLARVRAWLDAVRAQPDAGRVTLRLPGGSARPITQVGPGEILDAATATAPLGGPENFDWDTFVIHAGADRAAARVYYEALALSGVRVYLDRANLRPGHEWPRRLAAAMQRTRVFLVLVSTRWTQGWYNDDEVARAVSLCRAGAGRVILPVDLEVPPLPAHDYPYGTAHLQPVRVGALPPREAASAVVGAVKEAVSGLPNA